MGVVHILPEAIATYQKGKKQFSELTKPACKEGCKGGHNHDHKKD